MTTGAEFSTKASELRKSGTPLRDFWGNLANINTRFERDNMMVDLQFTGVKVIKSVTPYAFPVAQLTFRHPNTDRAHENSGWGIVLMSGEKLGYDDLADLKGKNIHMVAEEKTFERTAQPGQAPTEGESAGAQSWVAWRVTEVEEGSGGVSHTKADAQDSTGDMVVVLETLHGKDLTKFSEDILATDTGKKKDVQKTIFDGSLVPGLIAGGYVEQEGDVYNVTDAGRELIAKSKE